MTNAMQRTLAQIGNTTLPVNVRDAAWECQVGKFYIWIGADLPTLYAPLPGDSVPVTLAAEQTPLLRKSTDADQFSTAAPCGTCCV